MYAFYIDIKSINKYNFGIETLETGMPMSAPLPLIRPISDLRTNLNEVCDLARESQEPVFMTKNGKASLVVIDCKAYEEQRQHERSVQKLREAEIEARYREETVSQAELDEGMQRIFAHWGL